MRPGGSDRLSESVAAGTLAVIVLPAAGQPAVIVPPAKL
jgi:hypothetical protein